MVHRSILLITLFLIFSLALSACENESQNSFAPADTDEVGAAIATTIMTPTPLLSPDVSAAEQVKSPLANPDSPLAAPISPLDAPQPNSPLMAMSGPDDMSGCALDFPSPSNGSAIVCGGVISETPATKYLLAGDFYLAPVIYSKAKLEDGSEIDIPFVSLNVGSDKVADIKTESGGFVFLNVTPGEYSVVIYTPIQSFLFHDGTGQNTLIFRIEAGELKELEQLSLDW